MNASGSRGSLMKERKSVFPTNIPNNIERRLGQENNNGNNMFSGLSKRMTVLGANGAIDSQSDEIKVIKPDKIVEKIYM
jgi:hypothetical protein